jgi:hypothetical protein
MKSIVRVLSLAGALVIPFASDLGAQSSGIEFPSASPLSTVKQRVGLTDIEVVYSRPGVKGRAIFGGLVPYDEVWRTGANSVTKVTFSTPVELNGYEIAAGTYGLFTIPGKTEWTVIISKGTGAAGGGYQYDDKADLLRFKVTPVQRAEVTETFTIDINNIREDSATINLTWDKIAVPIKLKVDVTTKLVPRIEIAMTADGQKPYFQAAQFYYDQGLDLAKASKWVDAAIAEREAHFIVHLKAKILAKRGDKPGALAAATRSRELAVAAKDSGYIKLNDDLIASLKQTP